MTLPRLADPEALWLLLLGVPIVWLGVRSLVVLEPFRRWAAISLRLAVLAVLVLMLGGLQAVRTHEDLTVMAVVDRSESVRRFGSLPDPDRPGNRVDYTAWASRWLRLAGEDRRTDDRFGLMGFADRANLEVMPSPLVRTDAAGDAATGDGTDLVQALRASLGLLPPDSGSRLVLVSDGNHTPGGSGATATGVDEEAVLAFAREAKAAGVPIDVVPIRYAARSEVLVEAVYAPTQARQGRTVGVRVALRATAPAAGTLELLHDEELIDVNGSAPGTGLSVEPSQWTLERDAAADGSGQFVLVRQVDVPVALTGVNRFEAVFEPLRAGNGATGGGDQIAANNRAEGFTLVSGKGRVLVVDGEGGQPGAVLPAALRSHGIDLEVVPPAGLPGNLGRLQRYDAVLFQNVPRDQVTLTQQRNLVRYVHDLGGGFVMVGGTDSFGAGGWTNSPIDRRILPVECQIPTQTILPTGALVICIDRSGSMAAPVGGTGQSQIQLAADAAELALNTLYPQDLVGVIAFDGSPKWVQELQPNSDPARTAQLLRTLSPGGDTNIYRGLDVAYRELGRQDFTEAAIRHCILLTDGNEPAQNYPDLMRKFQAAGITLTTIGVGDHQNTTLLADLARLGGGTFYSITNPSTLPQVFIKEAKTIRKSLIRETEFTPRLVATGSPITRDLPGTPPLKGLVLTGPKRDPRVFTPMLGPEGEPLFAHWQTGLGRAAAFTSDATNRWAAQWLPWGGYADFWARTLRHVSRPTPTRTADLLAEVHGDRLQLRLDAAAGDDGGSGGSSGSFQNFLQARGAVIRPDGEVQEVTLRQTGPGLYEADAPADLPGSYVVSLLLVEPDGTRQTVYGGANRAVGRELRNFRSNAPLLERVARITGGRVLDPATPRAAGQGLFSREGYEFVSRSVRPLWREALVLLLVLVLLDVANRRLAYDPVAMWRWGVTRLDALLGTLSMSSKDRAEAATATRASLKTARERAAARMNEDGRRPAAAGGAAASAAHAGAPAVEAPQPRRTTKFEAAAGAEADEDFAAAIGGASRADPAGVRLARRAGGRATATAEADDDSTTSRLMAAKRAARERLEEE